MKEIAGAAGVVDHLELGMFGPNGTGTSMSKAPDRWCPTWENNRDLALAAEAAGLDFHIPFARWKGFGGESDPMGVSLDPITWTASLLAITKRITLFTTVHTPFTHPIVAAKHLATLDQIGPGRVGLNIVSGWNGDEADMFGIPQREHDERYEYTREWLDVMLKIWTRDKPFHQDGRFFNLREVIGNPKPRSGKIKLMSAGASSAGRSFAIGHCDLLFTILVSLEACRAEVAKVKEAARSADRRVDVYTAACVVCRPTRKEAEEYYEHISKEMADDPAVDNALRLLGLDCRSFTPEFYATFRGRFAASHGHYPIVGDPGDVAEGLRRVRDTGIRGLALCFMNFADELPCFRDEVLPRLVDMGVRRPAGG
ncbi:alkanesulfonate monooxygenase [Sorangium cellulosum]|uniref:Alkanesulfonate monooxygenase n=1 Tax=Sorangium cellulosum TaxID=56 RepID=A0A2L0ELM4_SORCE|nr:LLM class flavin-dependent oxidoreductase [Sorangium cellulosum]AUX40203.1 alkanesulfonate monooxygenase [Sorangium cellulosum]